MKKKKRKKNYCFFFKIRYCFFNRNNALQIGILQIDILHMAYGKFLFMSSKHTFSHVLILEIFRYHLKQMLLNIYKKAEF